jgi:hypothetical protein
MDIDAKQGQGMTILVVEARANPKCRAKTLEEQTLGMFQDPYLKSYDTLANIYSK